MGKTRDLFKKLRDTKATFHATMGSIKENMDITEAEDIKKRQQKYTEELYEKDLHKQDNHNDVITHLEPDILKCEIKWVLGNITMKKASGGDGIPVELFQILKDDAVKVLHTICQQIWITAVGMAPHSSTLAWKIPWTEEPGGLQSMGSLESDTTERLHFHFSLSCIGEGNGNPLQCSCLENPREGGAWWAAVYGVTQSQTQLN